jgi:hypothetical protein
LAQNFRQVTRFGAGQNGDAVGKGAAFARVDVKKVAHFRCAF